MKKFTKIAVVLVALVLALSVFTSCDEEDEKQPTSTGVTQSEWEKAFTFEGYSSKIYVDARSNGISSGRLLINGEDFKYEEEYTGLGSKENYAKKENTFYYCDCYSLDGETRKIHEVNNWSNEVPTTAKGMFDYMLKEFYIDSLKDKYNDFVYDSNFDFYSKTYNEYIVDDDLTVKDLTVNVFFKGDGYFSKKDENLFVSLGGKISDNEEIGIGFAIIDSTVEKDESKFNIDVTNSGVSFGENQ